VNQGKNSRQPLVHHPHICFLHNFDWVVDE